jgi:hypothetical protein
LNFPLAEAVGLLDDTSVLPYHKPDCLLPKHLRKKASWFINTLGETLLPGATSFKVVGEELLNILKPI